MNYVPYIPVVNGISSACVGVCLEYHVFLMNMDRHRHTHALRYPSILLIYQMDDNLHKTNYSNSVYHKKRRFTLPKFVENDDAPIVRGWLWFFWFILKHFHFCCIHMPYTPLSGWRQFHLCDILKIFNIFATKK